MTDNLTTGEDLVPCPFCGSPDVEVRQSVTDALVACNNCGSRTGLVFFGPSDAANAAKVKECVSVWNTRHPQAETDKRIAELETALTLAANRMGCIAIEFVAEDGSMFYEIREWEDETRAALKGSSNHGK